MDIFIAALCAVAAMAALFKPIFGSKDEFLECIGWWIESRLSNKRFWVTLLLRKNDYADYWHSRFKLFAWIFSGIFVFLLMLLTCKEYM